MNKMIGFLKAILRGFSQVMLRSNSLTGLLLLLGIFYSSWIMGLGALIGVFASTIAASILNYKKQDIHNGLYGFNGVLVGISLLLLFKISILLIILIAFGSVLSSLIMNYMRSRKLPAYTFPFVLSSWFLIVLIKSLNLVSSQSQELAKAANLDIASSLSYGFGQVMFQASMVSGIIFFIAILISSRKSAIYALLGSAL
jgi:urea transporter